LEFKGPAWRQSKKNERHIAALRTRVDGRITELLEVTKAAAYDAGRLAGIIAGKAESAAERTAPVTTEQTPRDFYAVRVLSLQMARATRKTKARKKAALQARANRTSDIARDALKVRAQAAASDERRADYPAPIGI
jgi:hypothetical protein